VRPPYAGVMTSRKRLPIRPVRRPLGRDRARLTAWRQSRAAAGVSGRTPTHDLREIFNAILYLNRTGIPWRYLPHDFPPYRTVYGYFAAWSKEGTCSTRPPPPTPPQGPGVLSIRYDSSGSEPRSRAAVNTASALVGDRRIVRNDPDIGPITRERRGPDPP